jgi:beta-galactosidase
LPSAELDYFAAVRAVHGALWRAGARVDFLRPGAVIEGYRIVCVPGLFLVDEEAARALESFVDGGGTAVVWYGSGIADPSFRVWPDGYPGPLRDLLGIRVEEFHPLPGGATVPLSTGDSGRLWSEHVRLAGAESVVDYAGGALTGRPAVTRHRYGGGTAWYVSTELDGLDAFVAGFVGEGTGGGAEVVDRDGWRFVLNHSDRPATVPAWGTDVVTGRAVDGEVTVPPGGYAVIRARP